MSAKPFANIRWAQSQAGIKNPVHASTLLAVAIDSDLEAVQHWAAAAPDLTILIDRDFTVAEQYGIVNVPATVWIDEDGRIVRPADTAMADDRFREFAPAEELLYRRPERPGEGEGDAQ